MEMAFLFFRRLSDEKIFGNPLIGGQIGGKDISACFLEHSLEEIFGTPIWKVRLVEMVFSSSISYILKRDLVPCGLEVRSSYTTNLLISTSLSLSL